MGVLTDFFAANPDELAAMAIEWGPVPPPAQPPKPKGGLFGFGRKPVVQDVPLPPLGPTLPAVQSKGILNTHLGVLDQFVTGTPYATLEASGVLDAIVRDNGRDGPWVFLVRRELRDALAGLAGGRIGEIAQQWGEDEEMGATGPDEFDALSELIQELASLAKTAVATDRDLYLWASL
jgi:hypothetical protein